MAPNEVNHVLSVVLPSCPWKIFLAGWTMGPLMCHCCGDQCQPLLPPPSKIPRGSGGLSSCSFPSSKSASSVLSCSLARRRTWSSPSLACSVSMCCRICSTASFTKAHANSSPPVNSPRSRHTAEALVDLVWVLPASIDDFRRTFPALSSLYRVAGPLPRELEHHWREHRTAVRTNLLFALTPHPLPKRRCGSGRRAWPLPPPPVTVVVSPPSSDWGGGGGPSPILSPLTVAEPLTTDVLHPFLF